MTNWLDELGKDALPPTTAALFVHWCLWEQAKPALIAVLRAVELETYAEGLFEALDLAGARQQAEQASSYIKKMRMQTHPLGLSAAEAAVFEFIQITQAADEDNLDAEGVAFHAARVCGWSAWAVARFSDPQLKTTAEKDARAAQEAKLQSLMTD